MKKFAMMYVFAAVAALFCNDASGADGEGSGSGWKTFTVSGKTIQRAVAPKMPPVIDAYNRRFNDKPDLAAGTVTVRFSLDGDGRVYSAEVTESTLRDEEFENTVVEIVKEWVFTKKDGLGGLSEFVYTFTFQQREVRGK